MKIYNKIDSFLDARSKLNSKKISLVPTMGSIHEGHLSLINKAKSYGDIVIVTIFVNPILPSFHLVNTCNVSLLVQIPSEPFASKTP